MVVATSELEDTYYYNGKTPLIEPLAIAHIHFVIMVKACWRSSLLMMRRINSHHSHLINVGYIKRASMGVVQYIGT